MIVLCNVFALADEIRRYIYRKKTKIYTGHTWPNGNLGKNTILLCALDDNFKL